MWLNIALTVLTVLEGWLSGLEALQYSLHLSEAQGSNSQSFVCVVPMDFLNVFIIFMYKFSVPDAGAVLIGPWY